MIGFNNKLPLILSVASLMLSMAAFGNAYPRELGIGYLGIIVGILCNSIISDIKNGKLERINEYELLHLAVLLENLRKFDNPAVFALDNLLHQYIQERRKGE